MDAKIDMDSLDEFNWLDLIDYGGLLNDVSPPPDLHGNSDLLSSKTVCAAIEASRTGTPSFETESTEGECSRKRPRSECGVGSKACRERLRREKMNDRFVELSAVLEHGRHAKADKVALLGDAIKLLNQLPAESQDHKESNERLLEEIKVLKAEKNELRREKQSLKAEKEVMEQQQLKTMSAPGMIPAVTPVYQGGMNKVPVIPSYGFFPMWQYLPRDTYQDHQLRPPAA